MSTQDTVMLTDRLLSVLREAARPMSTPELAELMPWKHERTAHGGCQWWCDRHLRDGVRMLACHGGWHLIAFRPTAHGLNGIYRHLRALEQRSLVRRDGSDGSRRVYWSYCADDGRPAAVGTLNRLETLIAADPPPTPDDTTTTAILDIAHSMLGLIRASVDAMSDPEPTNTAARRWSRAPWRWPSSPNTRHPGRAAEARRFVDIPSQKCSSGAGFDWLPTRISTVLAAVTPGPRGIDG